MSRKVLSPFGFYGGKNKMASMICSMIDNNTDIYIEPYGGACRVLLNKKPHKQEIYNDFSYGLSNFFQTLSDRELVEKVIQGLYEIEPSEKVFEEMRRYKCEHELELTLFLKEQFKKVVWDLCEKYKNIELKKLHKVVNQCDYYRIICYINEINKKSIIVENYDKELFDLYANQYEAYWNIVKDTYNKEYFNQYENCYIENEGERHRFACRVALETVESFTSDILNSNISCVDYDPVRMAIATFITYELSRDGMGIYYRKSGISLKSYYRAVNNLKEVGDRVENVHVTQVDAMLLIKQYCDCENAMFYLDPSYLNSDNDDLGKDVYARSYKVDEHKILAETICNAKAKIILSNYDVEIYNTYLTEDNGWRKIYYETTTSLGGKKDNKRTEVLWCNY